jgi:hypothetical protein
LPLEAAVVSVVRVVHEETEPKRLDVVPEVCVAAAKT